MSGIQSPDLFGAVAAAAHGVAMAIRRDPSSAVLFWGDPPELEVVHNAGLPAEVCRLLTASGGRHLAQAIRRAGHPLRVVADRLPDEARGLGEALRAHDIAGLAVFPLFGEAGIVGCLVVPLDDAPGPPPVGDQWRAACRALAALQVAAGSAALKTVLAEDRRTPLDLCDGVLVIDRWERVLFADGIVREGPGWRRADPFGRTLSSLPGGALLSGVHLSKPGSLDWEEHLMPPLEGHGIPAAVAALPVRLAGEQGDGSRVILVRDLTSREPGSPGESDRSGRMSALALRVAHAADELTRVLPELQGDGSAVPGTSRLLKTLLDVVREAPDVVREVLARTLDEEHGDQIDLNGMLSAILGRVRPDLETERIRVFTFFRPELPRVTGDALEVMRSLRTLVEWARASLRSNGGTLTLRSWLEEGWVCAAVSDDGAGAGSVSDVSAFEPLFNVADVTEDVELEEVREVIQRHGGRFQVERRPRVWNRYTIMLPMERRTPAAAPRSATTTEVARGEDGSLHVLVVDDNGALRSVLRRYLERRGHRVTEAQDGEQALGMVTGNPFDRVIVDIHMPGKSGPEFYACLEEVAPALRSRTLFMTGGFLEGDTEQFLEETGRPAIRKPFDLAELAKTVESA